MSHPNHPFAEQSHLGTPLSETQEQTAWMVFGVLVAALTAGYWNMFEYTASYWGNALYSHGYLVPFGCMYLFWQRRRQLTQVASGERWIGLAVLVASLTLRLWASYYDANPADRFSYITALLGVTLIVGGWSMLRWAGPPILVLAFMFPLPSVLEQSVLYNLQRVAAISSTWTLQLLGIPALREGSKIAIDALDLDVADACSGLRMTTIFGAMSVAIAIMVNRPWWDRLAILVFAIPVALFTNIIRITVTALIYMAFPEGEAIQHAVHDWAGLAMMPIAMGILWLELQLLHKITVPIDSEEEYASFGAAHV
jgi:exosortase